MIAVADASPLNYLILIEHEALLERLYRRILIPEAVFRELQAPTDNRTWTYCRLQSVHFKLS